MKQKSVSLKVCMAILVISVLWRIMGAPLTADDFVGLKTSFWQAKILLPQRMERMFRLWVNTSKVEEIKATRKEECETDGQNLLVYVDQNDTFVKMTMAEYVCGVLAAEMPAQYHMEALKAQALAARTRAMWQVQQGGCDQHAGADICTDSTHCQGYASVEECRERWGDSYEAYWQRMVQAQQATAGQWISYADKPINVLYHANSGGRTEDAETVFSQSVPYLVSVESMENENARNFYQETTFTYDELASVFGCSAQEVRRSFAIGGYTPSGRVSHIQVADKRIEATELRKMLNLKSTWLSVTADENGILFLQRGYGHGVGMSQAGANQMASSGADYVKIIQHYYTDVDVVFPV